MLEHEQPHLMPMGATSDEFRKGAAVLPQAAA
jgi:hypothetical protein